jgi:small subunit ribosomal protein S1
LQAEQIIVKGWLTAEYDYTQPRRGQILKGVIVQMDGGEVIVDVGLKRDGLVLERDLRYLDEEDIVQLEPGKEVLTRVVYPRDREGRLVLSVYQARFQRDWEQASAYQASGEIWEGEVSGHNKGGLTIEFGSLRGFVPLSHLSQRGIRQLPPDEHEARMQSYAGRSLPLKVIEVDPARRRLILSERLGRRAMQEQTLERLLSELTEGQVIKGQVTNLCDFGAFVDIGGAEGLVHVSELAYRTVRHPSEVLRAGEEIEVYVLRLDHPRKRISLSIRRLQPDPWDKVQETYTEGQLVEGTVTHLAEFGAFVALEEGVEGLAHISELADPPIANPDAILSPGESRLFRILHIDTQNHRIGLSLKQADYSPEVDEWLAEQPLALGETDDPAAILPPEAVEQAAQIPEAVEQAVQVPES